MPPLPELVAARFAESGIAFAVRHTFTGTGPESVAAAVDAFCREHLGSPVGGGVFFDASVGTVIGVELADGRRVVVKAHLPGNVPPRFLDAVQTVQRRLAGDGFPCPEPLLGPRPLELGTAVVETLLDRGAAPDAHDPALRRLLARGLADLVERCRDLTHLDALAEHAMVASAGALWPTPHDRRFDFAGTSAGAAWIDAIATRALALRDGVEAPLVVGHSDWRAQHVRVADGALTAVYDWDSLRLETEHECVGSAAHAFTMNWETREPRLPSPDEARAFVAEYEEARGRPLTEAERRGAFAALVYTMSYAARCEHSDGLTDFGERPPAGAPAPIPDDPLTSARAYIRAFADDLLAS